MDCQHSVADYYALRDDDLGHLLWCVCRLCGQTVVLEAA